MLISNMILVSLRRVAPDTSEQRSRSGLCDGVIRREATETERLVINNYIVIEGVLSLPLICMNNLIMLYQMLSSHKQNY